MSLVKILFYFVFLPIIGLNLLFPLVVFLPVSSLLFGLGLGAHALWLDKALVGSVALIELWLGYALCFRGDRKNRTSLESVLVFETRSFRRLLGCPKQAIAFGSGLLLMVILAASERLTIHGLGLEFPPYRPEWDSASYLLLICILIPFAEEVYFRRTFFVLARGKTLLKVLLNALIFVVIHSPGPNVQSVVSSIGVVVLVCFASWLLLSFGSTMAAVLLHVTYNASYFLFERFVDVVEISSILENSVLSFVVVFGWFLVFLGTAYSISQLAKIPESLNSPTTQSNDFGSDREK